MADAARKLGLSRGRLTQILNLKLLCPEIQSDIVSLPPILGGRDPINERVLRPIVAEPMWERQVATWHALQHPTGESSGARAR